MARLAILGLLSLVLLVSETSAVNETLVDDADYGSGSGDLYPDYDDYDDYIGRTPGEYVEPVIPLDTNWTICERDRRGEP